MLVERRDALFQFFHQPAGERFGLSNRQLAKLGAGASNGAAPEGGGFHAKTRLIQACGDQRSFGLRHVHDDQVLGVGSAQLAVAVTLRQISGNPHLLRGDSAAQNRSANVKQAWLFLRMYSGVVATMRELFMYWSW